MVEQEPKVELRIGEDEIILQGSEDFISGELETILSSIDFSPSNSHPVPQVNGGVSENETESVTDESESANDDSSPVEPDYPSAIIEVADRLDVSPELVGNHFYIEDDNIHIQDPYEIQEKYALIGYCMLKSEMTGQMVFDNRDTRDKLVDQERIPIENWGRTLLHNLRESNIIKNDPDSDKSKYVPFKITPKAEKQFREWLLTDENA